jgi:L-2-hydroxyglutarate oxidase LhgO
MEKIHITVIGAGIVGLAITERLAGVYENVVLVEQEQSFGRHTSSRNSEVIHSGVYYVPGSLKATLCVRGNPMLYRFLSTEELPHRNCEKFIIATNEREERIIKNIFENGKKNGVPGLELVDGGYIGRQEPAIKAKMGIHVPSTGIMDVHSCMKRLAHKAESSGALISYGSRVTAIEKRQDCFLLRFDDGYEVRSDIVINSGGIFADRVADMAGIDIDDAGYKLRYCKGQYYKTTKYRGMDKLIYPVPDPSTGSLGIHTRLHLDGTLAFGPNAFFVQELDYSFDDSFREQVHRSIATFIDIDYEDLHPDDAGIRPQLIPDGHEPMDFIITNEKEKGLNGLINLIGIESPGLTSCLSIAEYICDTVLPAV